MSTLVVSERLAFGIKEAAQSLGLGKSKLRMLIREGTLPTVRVGDRVLIRRESLEKLLQDGAR
jgi:excisionase family DNA binding protein